MGCFSTAQVWEMTANLERQMKIPSHIIQSLLRLDFIFVDKVTKQLSLLELTVPRVERRTFTKTDEELSACQ